MAPALEELLYQPIPVLDKGFVRVIDYMGDDQAIVQAARVSYGAGTKTVRTDAGLIDYLMRHQHTSPFEMCDIKLHVKLPVFVARQWIRHRTASVNEYSGRYSEIADTFYEPEPSAIGRQSALNRQGSAGPVSAGGRRARARRVARGQRRRPTSSTRRCCPDEDDAVAREVARIGLPVSHYTEWYWKTNLHNLLRFLELRMDSHAQYEIRVYAEAIGSIVAAWVPLTWASFLDKRFGFGDDVVEGHVACCGPSWPIVTWTWKAPACRRARRGSCATPWVSSHPEPDRPSRQRAQQPTTATVSGPRSGSRCSSVQSARRGRRTG